MPHNNRRKACEPSAGKCRNIYLFPVLILVLITSFTVSAQSQSQRPRVGLVLSGGGSMGMAHVGLLKVMEEAGLRPDYITGTSMGSIIGGFYALGYSADSLHSILNTVDWDLIMSNTIPQNRIIFNEKKHFDNSILSLPVSLKKLKLPSGLISGQQIENTLSYYAWPAADINDFLNLPIPYACLATDLLTVTKVKLSKGYLPDAMRASSAIPSVFSPIKIDTFLLSDGGFLRNFPGVEAKDMGADIIIGSYTAFRPNTEDELQDITGIVKQIVMSRSIQDFENQRDLIDFLIIPNLKGMSSFDFNAADSLVERGYKASLPYKEQFKKLADSLNMLGRQPPLQDILNKQYYSFDRIEISGDSLIPERQILGVLDIEPGEPVDKSTLYEKIDLLYGKAWFEKVKYRIEPRNDSLILVIDCIEKPRSLFYGSAHYDNALGAGLLVSLSFKNLPTQASVFNLDYYIGQYYRVRNSFSQYINRNQRLGFSIDFYADNTLIPKLDLRGETGDVISRNFSTGLSINRMLGLNQMMNISANFENRYLLPRYVSENYLKYLSYDYITAAFNYSVNTLNNRHFPDRGSILNIHAGTSGLIYGRIKTGTVRNTYKKDDPGSFRFERFYTITGSYRQYITKVKRFTFSLRGDVIYISDCDSVSSHNNFFLLGGQTQLNARSIPVTGFHPNQIPVKRSAGVGMAMDMELIKDVHLSISANIFAAQEADRVTGYSLLAGYGLEAGYMSIIGPIKAGIMHGFYDRENHFSKIKAYISAGYLF